MNILEIIKGWANSTNPSKEMQIIAEERMSACNSCPHLVELEEGLLKSLVNLTEREKQEHVFKCGLCGCPVLKKAYSLVAQCPDTLSRWKKI